MSDILTIDTGANLVKEQRIDPLPLYDDNHPMLKNEIPIYMDTLPNPQMNLLIQRMKMTMKQFGGVGLAANQCGVFERVFVIGFGDSAFACINPRVIEVSTEIDKSKEGCLSYPGMFLNVPRHKWIVAEYTNEMGEKIQQRFEGITARCYLHELDHLDGIRFVERVGPVAVRMAKDKQQKMIKKIQRKMKNKNSLFV